MITKAVIPAAGMGTRLLSFTKEQPKEMLPIVVKNGEGVLFLKPTIQAIFEQLYDFGVREFCFIVGRGKRSIEDHFTTDHAFAEKLESIKKHYATDLKRFYERIDDSLIVWTTQSEPKGFGHAVLCAKKFVRDDSFIVHAGDTYIHSANFRHLNRIVNLVEHDYSASFAVKTVKDPSQYGVVKVQEKHDDYVSVSSAVEKPKKYVSNLAIMPIYAFRSEVFRILSEIPNGLNGELQLTDAIHGLIEKKLRVAALPLLASEPRLDIGTPENYVESIVTSYTICRGDEVPINGMKSKIITGIKNI